MQKGASTVQAEAKVLSVAKALKFTKTTVTAVNIIATVTSVADIVIDARNGGVNNIKSEHIIDLLASSMCLLPVIGQAWGLIWFSANLISYGVTGKSVSANMATEDEKH